jgi:bacterioferritin-associated ferredoxin
MDLPIVAEIKGRDFLKVTSLEPFQMEVVGCHWLLKQLREGYQQYGADLRAWPLPDGKDHASLLIKELILKLQGKWQHVYTQDEVCHCRTVSLETVEQALFLGAQTPEMVSKWTSASTACGTCRPDVEKIIQFRLG